MSLIMKKLHRFFNIISLSSFPFNNIALERFADPFIMKLDEKAEDVGCAPTANVSVVVHGWLEGLNTTKWVNETVVNLLKYRTGCVFFFDYSQYSKISDYNQLVPHYEKLAEVLTKYLQNIGNP